MKSLEYNYNSKEINELIQSSINSEDYNLILKIIIQYVHNLIKKPEVIGKYFYLNELDELLNLLANRIEDKFCKNFIKEGFKGYQNNGLILATEIYNTGGHTNVIADIVKEYPTTNIILTDLFGRYQKGLWSNFTSLIPVETLIYILPSESLINKVVRLANHLIRHTGPLFLLNHQDDVVILIAALISKKTNIYFIHHADYSPCLGCTLTQFKHIDLFKEKYNKCFNSLDKKPTLMPLAVKDIGSKPILRKDKVNTVTSGSFNKYNRDGSLSYKLIVERILNTIDGNHYHIGKIDDSYLIELKNYLEQQKINFNRFLYVEHVPSLWHALKEINAEIYIASAPINGGRTEIEAQGCGYPIISFKDETKPILEYSLHSSTTLYYSSLDELELRIDECVESIQFLGESSRNFYLENFDFKFMKNEIDKMFDEVR